MIMALMTVTEVATFLAIQDIRVERLARENLLVAAGKDDNGKPMSLYSINTEKSWLSR